MARTSGQPIDLVAALEQRMRTVLDLMEACRGKLRTHQEAMRTAADEFEGYKGEMEELKKMLARYSAAQGGTLFPMAAPPKNGSAPVGPSEMLVKIVNMQADRQIRAGELVDRFVEEVEAGHVRTETGDARKLGSSLIPQLVRTGRLNREGDEVFGIEGVE